MNTPSPEELQTLCKKLIECEHLVVNLSEYKCYYVYNPKTNDRILEIERYLVTFPHFACDVRLANVSINVSDCEQLYDLMKSRYIESRDKIRKLELDRAVESAIKHLNNEVQ